MELTDIVETGKFVVYATCELTGEGRIGYRARLMDKLVSLGTKGIIPGDPSLQQELRGLGSALKVEVEYRNGYLKSGLTGLAFGNERNVPLGDSRTAQSGITLQDRTLTEGEMREVQEGFNNPEQYVDAALPHFQKDRKYFSWPDDQLLRQHLLNILQGKITLALDI